MTPNQIRAEAEKDFFTRFPNLSPEHVREHRFFVDGYVAGAERMPQVDDAMVERAFKAFWNNVKGFRFDGGVYGSANIRAALEAALSTEKQNDEPDEWIKMHVEGSKPLGVKGCKLSTVSKSCDVGEAHAMHVWLDSKYLCPGRGSTMDD